MESVLLISTPSFLGDFCVQGQRKCLEQHVLQRVWLVQRCFPHLCSLVYVCVCLLRGSSLRCRCVEAVTQRVEKRANWKSSRGSASSLRPVVGRVWGERGSECPTSAAFERALFNYAHTTGGTFACPRKAWMSRLPCCVVVWAPKFARSVDFFQEEPEFGFLCEILILNGFIF